MVLDSPVGASSRDLSTLQGTWEQIVHEVDGITNAPDIYSASGTLTTFNGNYFAVRSCEGELLLEGTFTIDALTTPKSITWVDSIGEDAGKQLPASYMLDSDRFVFIATDEGLPRPTTFRTERGQVMRTFVRRR
jgi:uncharacterized protein (TIGR03067 family)